MMSLVQDSEYFNSMVWIKENDPSDLELHFSVEEDHFGEVCLFFIIGPDVTYPSGFLASITSV